MIVLDFVKQNMPAGWKQTPSGWVSGNCPMCTMRGHSQDKRKRGGFLFDDEKFQYNCFNCGFKTGWSPGRRIAGNLKDLLERLGADPAQIQRINFELLKQQEEDDIVGQFIKIEEKKKQSVNWPEISLPQDSALLSEVDTSTLTNTKLEKFIKACEYIESRNVGFYDKWYWSPYSHFSNRIILPFYYKNKTVGFTARWVGNTPDKETPKYYHQMPKNFVYNLDQQHKHKYIIVAEGQMDALLVGGVATGGNTPSKVQCELINDLEKEVIVIPDADRAGNELVKVAVAQGWSVSFPPWEGCKDAADAVQKYGRLFTVRSILDAAEQNTTKIQLLAKSYCR